MSKRAKNPASSSAAPDAPVYHVDEDTQVDLLAQALLREYMHKKRFSTTLAAFDQEHPRDDKTVSSRAVMHDLMALTTPQQPGETIMETLCRMRVNKKDNAQTLQRIRAELAASLDEESKLRAQCDATEAALATKREEAAQLDRKKKPKKKLKKTEDESSSQKKKRSSKSDATALLTIDELLEKDDVPAPNKQQASAAAAAAGTPTLTSSTRGEDTATTEPSRHTPRVAESSSSESSEDPPEAADDSDDYAAAIKAIRAEQHTTAAAHTVKTAAGTDDRPAARVKAGWDLDVVHTPPPPQQQAVPAVVIPAVDSHERPAPRPPYRAPQEGELGQDLALELYRCLTSGKRMVPASFQQQGFYRSTVRNAPPYGLEQRLGGPCGVLAVVQARLAQRMVHPESPTRGNWDASLVRALSDTLAMIASHAGPVRIVLQPAEDAWPAAIVPNSLREQKQWFSLLRLRSPINNDRDTIEALLRGTEVYHQWTRPDGPGLLCFLLSCVVTRGGADHCMRDMDSVQPLIVEHGYCAQELANLLLCGRCTSNAVDGTVELDGGLQLRGFPSALDVGFLTVLEYKGLMHVGKFGKFPTALPAAWVIYNESHYTVIFLKNPSIVPDCTSGQLRPLPAAIDVFYYDQQGQQDSEVKLTIAPRDISTPAAVTPLTSYVELVLRTIPQWATATFDWNGTQPLL